MLMNLQKNPLISKKYGLRKIFECTGIYRNTHEYPRFEGVHSKKYYKIHGNTKEYSTMHMNLQENNGFLRNTV